MNNTILGFLSPSILSLLVIGGWVFWSWIAVATCLIITTIALEEKYGWSNFIVCGFFVLFGKGLVDVASMTYKDLTWYLIGYLVIGSIWSLVKWNFRVKEEVSEFKREYPQLFEYLQSHTEEEYNKERSLIIHSKERSRDENDQYAWMTKDCMGRILGDLKSNISPSNHKNQIIGWLSYWPWSVFWDCTADLFKNLYKFLQNAYHIVSEHHLKNSKLNIKL